MGVLMLGSRRFLDKDSAHQESQQWIDISQRCWGRKQDLKGGVTDGKMTSQDGPSVHAWWPGFLSVPSMGVLHIQCLPCDAPSPCWCLLWPSLLSLPHCQCNEKLYLPSPQIRVLLEKSSSHCLSSLPRGPGETLMPASWWMTEMPTTTWTTQMAWRKFSAH